MNRREAGQSNTSGQEGRREGEEEGMEDWGREFEEGEGFGARQASQWIQHPWGLTSRLISAG